MCQTNPLPSPFSSLRLEIFKDFANWKLTYFVSLSFSLTKRTRVFSNWIFVRLRLHFFSVQGFSVSLTLLLHFTIYFLSFISSSRFVEIIRLFAFEFKMLDLICIELTMELIRNLIKHKIPTATIALTTPPSPVALQIAIANLTTCFKA